MAAEAGASEKTPPGHEKVVGIVAVQGVHGQQSFLESRHKTNIRRPILAQAWAVMPIFSGNRFFTSATSRPCNSIVCPLSVTWRFRNGYAVGECHILSFLNSKNRPFVSL